VVNFSSATVNGAFTICAMTGPTWSRDFVDASHSSPRELPDGRASTFDVRGWLAGLVN